MDCIMSNLQHPARPLPPGDEDLQHLYDEVWRIFDEEGRQLECSPGAGSAPANVREPYANGSSGDLDSFGLPSPKSRPTPASPRPPCTYLFFIVNAIANVTKYHMPLLARHVQTRMLRPCLSLRKSRGLYLCHPVWHNLRSEVAVVVRSIPM